MTVKRLEHIISYYYYYIDFPFFPRRGFTLRCFQSLTLVGQLLKQDNGN